MAGQPITAGPWELVRRRFRFDVRLGAQQACSVHIAYGDTEHNIPRFGTAAEAEANALAITAIPEFVAACQRLVESYDPDAGTYALGLLREAVELASHALSKARQEAA